MHGNFLVGPVVNGGPDQGVVSVEVAEGRFHAVLLVGGVEDPFAVPVAVVGDPDASAEEMFAELLEGHLIDLKVEVVASLDLGEGNLQQAAQMLCSKRCIDYLANCLCRGLATAVLRVAGAVSANPSAPSA